MTDPNKIPSKFETDSPETKDQAEELLKQYYKEHRGEKNFPRRYNLLSWRLHPSGIMVVIDGASGRKLEFVVNEAELKKAAEQDIAETAEEALLDAEAEAAEAEAKAKAKAAQAKAEQAKLNAKSLKKTPKLEKGK